MSMPDDNLLPDGDHLLDRKGLAQKLLRHRSYIDAMVRDGFVMPGGRATANQAIRWLIAHPNFKQKKSNLNT